MTKLITMFCLLTAFAIAGAAQAGTNGIDDRETNQRKRIVNGVQSGDLSLKETGKLLKQQAEIRKFERKAKADGTVTLGERFRLHRELNQAGRNIRRKRNN